MIPSSMYATAESLQLKGYYSPSVPPSPPCRLQSRMCDSANSDDMRTVENEDGCASSNKFFAASKKDNKLDYYDYYEPQIAQEMTTLDNQANCTIGYDLRALPIFGSNIFQQQPCFMSGIGSTSFDQFQYQYNYPSSNYAPFNYNLATNGMPYMNQMSCSQCMCPMKSEMESIDSQSKAKLLRSKEALDKLKLGMTKSRAREKYRVVYSTFQRFELEKEFCFSRFITTDRRAHLAQSLGLTTRQVKIWFQNRRAKEKKILFRHNASPPPAIEKCQDVFVKEETVQHLKCE